MVEEILEEVGRLIAAGATPETIKVIMESYFAFRVSTTQTATIAWAAFSSCAAVVTGIVCVYFKHKDS